ncbi:hypothetical protein B7W89_15500 [Agrobacterium tumefaciens]|nr:hypothetical protein B7W89_15500 [Agrobacterium tumefaciens]
MRAFVKTHQHDRFSGLVDNILDAVAIVRKNGCYLKHSTAPEHTQLCATHNFGGIGMNFGFLDTYHPKKIV